MPDHILERRVWLARPRPEVFDFFADPANLPRIQPAWARPRWIAPPPPRLVAGAVLDFRVPGLPVAWRGMVPEFPPPPPLPPLPPPSPAPPRGPPPPLPPRTRP